MGLDSKERASLGEHRDPITLNTSVEAGPTAPEILSVKTELSALCICRP